MGPESNGRLRSEVSRVEQFSMKTRSRECPGQGMAEVG